VESVASLDADLDRGDAALVLFVQAGYVVELPTRRYPGPAAESEVTKVFYCAQVSKQLGARYRLSDSEPMIGWVRKEGAV